MKSLNMVVSAIGLMVAGQAMAQSSVTLYGVLDVGIQYVHNVNGQANRISMASGNYLGDRWGLKGKEDLGGGTSVVFTLENGFSLNNGAIGQGGRMFGRQAFVGIANDKYGTVTVGRQYDPVVDLLDPFQGNWFQEYFSTPGDIDNTQNSSRFNNSIKYASPTFHGITGEVLYGVGGVAGSTGSGQSYSAALQYNPGAFGIAVGFFRIDNGNPTVSTRGTSSADTLFYTSVNLPYATASNIDSARIAAKYDFGAVQWGGYYSQTSYKSDGKSTFSGNEVYRDLNTYLLWRASPFVWVQAGYNFLKASGNSSAHYHQITAAIDYFLSKRTDLYLSAGFTRASGHSGTGLAQAVIGPADIDAGGSTQELVMAGIKHKF
jgi:predicted porin